MLVTGGVEILEGADGKGLALPEDLRRLYVKLLRDKHGATRQQARQLTGEDYGLRFGEGDAQKWAAFLARGKR